MDEGKIEYYRNGIGLGEAFNNLDKGPGLALHPAVSLAFNDGLTGNFGGSPFRYPVNGYKPLQDPPDYLLYKADILLEYLVNTARLICSSKVDRKSNDGTGVSNSTYYMLISSLLVEKIAPLLINSYVVEEKILKLIKSLCVLK